MSFVSHLSCPRCDARHDAAIVHNLCGCGSPLLVEYDLAALAASVSKDDIAARVHTMWRYHEFLPVADVANIVTLGEGFTPLLEIADGLMVKDEGLNPTGSFKARGASCGISRARELGVRHVALPTAGNAGGAWACYGAAAGIPVHVAMPKDAPRINQLECEMYGAELTLVDGLIDEAGAATARGVAEHGWFDASTLKEPYRIEGKKTLGLEIAEQLGWKMPDAIVYPAGGGVGIIGIWRALEQLREIGWVEGSLPRLIVVQAKGCAPLVRAFDRDLEESEFWEDASTIAAGLRVPKALGDFLVLRAVRATGGIALAVSDEQIRDAMRDLARDAGILASPEGAATFAAAKLLRVRQWFERGEQVVLINTGSALKYPDVMEQIL